MQSWKNDHVQILLDVLALEDSTKRIGDLVQGYLLDLFRAHTRDIPIAYRILSTYDIVSELTALSGSCRHAYMCLYVTC